MTVAYRDESVRAALDDLSKSYGITVDHSALNRADEKDDQRKVTLAVIGHPLRDVVGILLYQTHCRCELRGETLVVLPRQSDEERPGRNADKGR